jgi:hypothetical protein
VIAARWGLLLVATWLLLAALGATASDLPPSALRLAVTAVTAGVAPLFWPGSAATPGRTALRIAVWSAAAASLAAIVLRLIGGAAQPLPRILGSCTMLLLILLVTHTVAAALENRWRGLNGDATLAREMAGRAAALALALLGSLPLWLGPVAELLASRHGRIIDAVIGISPLTHLALASGNDLLHNPWLYRHSNLAALRFSYPDPAELAWFYASACSLLALIALATRRARRLDRSTDSTMEKPR